MSLRIEVLIQQVRHRLDDLESDFQNVTCCLYVRHRLDDLEIKSITGV